MDRKSYEPGPGAYEAANPKDIGKLNSFSQISLDPSNIPVNTSITQAQLIANFRRQIKGKSSLKALSEAVTGISSGSQKLMG